MLGFSLTNNNLYASQSDNAAARFTGEINERSVDAFLAAIDGRVIERLYVDSSGGEVKAAIRFGYWIYAHQVDIVVDGVCLSSCANYLFSAARHKRVLAGSLVAWHGNYIHLYETGLWREEINQRMRRTGESREQARDAVSQQVLDLVGRERRFFKHVGVNQYVCWVGKMPPFNAPDYFALSAGDVALFGLRNLSLPARYLQIDYSHHGVNVQTIHLRE